MQGLQYVMLPLPFNMSDTDGAVEFVLGAAHLFKLRPSQLPKVPRSSFQKHAGRGRLFGIRLGTLQSESGKAPSPHWRQRGCANNSFMAFAVEQAQA